MQESRSEARRAQPRRPGDPVAAGVPATVEEAYLQFAPRLRKIAVRNFGIPPGEAETLVHDVFATYFLQAATVEVPEKYLIGAICNASRNYWRRADATMAVFCDETPCAATPGPDLLHEIHRKLLLTRILAEISEKCRQLLQRYYMGGESTRTIADHRGSSPATVLVLLHKCRKRALAAYHALMKRS